MSKFLLEILPLLALFSLNSCNENNSGAVEPGSVEMTFNGFYEDQPLLMYERAYDYPADMKTKFQLFHFYLSEVTLLPEKAGAEGEVTLADVALISFVDIQDDAAAARGVTLKAENIPPGRYGGIRFGIGLTEKLNSTQPGDYAPGHPLTDNYWSWATGYVFFKVEGNADTNGDGDFSEKLTFHIGLDEHYRQKTFDRPLEIGNGQNLQLNFDVDLAKVLAPTSNDYVDFRKVTQDHTNDLELARFLADNLQEAIRMK